MREEVWERPSGRKWAAARANGVGYGGGRMPYVPPMGKPVRAQGQASCASAPAQTLAKFGPEMVRGRTKSGRLLVWVAALDRDLCMFRPKQTWTDQMRLHVGYGLILGSGYFSISSILPLYGKRKNRCFIRNYKLRTKTKVWKAGLFHVSLLLRSGTSC